MHSAPLRYCILVFHCTETVQLLYRHCMLLSIAAFYIYLYTHLSFSHTFTYFKLNVSLFSFVVLIFSCSNIESRPCMCTHTLPIKLIPVLLILIHLPLSTVLSEKFHAEFFFNLFPAAGKDKGIFQGEKNQHLLVRNVRKTSEEISTHYFYHGDRCMDGLQTTAERQYISW